MTLSGIKGPIGGMPVEASHFYDRISLRDYFAAAALQGAWAANQLGEDWCKWPGIAARCYEVADAMLTEREKGG